MITDTAPATEHVYQVSDVEQLELLKQHFNWVYRLFIDYQYVPNACYEKIGDLERYYSGLPTINFNAVVGELADPQEYAERIEEQLQFFGNTPFFWYVEESVAPAFKEALKMYGFIDIGVFRGAIGALAETMAPTSIPQDCILEMVKDETTMAEFNDLVCGVFGINSSTKSAYQDLLWNLTQEKECQWYHWVARKQGKVVSAVSTMIRDGIVSFWNGASIPEVRKQGFSTALRHFSLKHAMAHGARFGSSYLMSEGLAAGICSKLGYTTKWRFHAFASPEPSYTEMNPKAGFISE